MSRHKPSTISLLSANTEFHNKGLTMWSGVRSEKGECLDTCHQNQNALSYPQITSNPREPVDSACIVPDQEVLMMSGETGGCLCSRESNRVLHLSCWAVCPGWLIDLLGGIHGFIIRQEYLIFIILCSHRTRNWGRGILRITNRQPGVGGTPACLFYSYQ